MKSESVFGQVVLVIDRQEIQRWLEDGLVNCKSEIQFRERCGLRFGQRISDLRVSWTAGGVRLVNLYLDGRSDYIFACVAVTEVKG